MNDIKKPRHEMPNLQGIKWKWKAGGKRIVGKLTSNTFRLQDLFYSCQQSPQVCTFHYDMKIVIKYKVNNKTRPFWPT